MNAPLTYTHSSGYVSSENTGYDTMFVKVIMWFTREATSPYFLIHLLHDEEAYEDEDFALWENQHF